VVPYDDADEGSYPLTEQSITDLKVETHYGVEDPENADEDGKSNFWLCKVVAEESEESSQCE
jgi:hypothetical protein